MYLENRINKVKQSLSKSKSQGLIVTDTLNVRYLSGFEGYDSYLLITPKENFFFTDFRYIDQIQKECKGFEIVEHKDGLLTKICDLIIKKDINKISFESTRLTFAQYSVLKKLLLPKNIELEPKNKLVESLRRCKDELEIESIKKAIKITEKAFLEFKNKIRPGLSSAAIANSIEYFIRKNGAKSGAFEFIVAIGNETALPHAIPKRRKLKDGEPVLIDFGGNYKLYNCDITRIFFQKKYSKKMKTIYEIIKNAQNEAIKTIRSGVLMLQVDKAARDIIEKEGFGKYYRHGLGHGVGLNIHEEPHINWNNKKPLEEGMVFTIEPAIYLPNEFGIRLEDMVLVKKNSCEILTHLSKNIDDYVIQ